MRGRTTSYRYDELDRLEEAVERSSGFVTAEWGYGYDSRSNITQRIKDGATTSLDYNGANQLVREGATTFAYDGAGNLASSSAGLALTYDAKGHTRSHSPAGTTGSRQYDYTGATQQQRVRSGERTFTNSLLGVSSAADGALSSLHWTRDDRGGLVGQRRDDGNPLSAQTRHYYLFDALGSVVAITDADGALAANYRYAPYGENTLDFDTVGNPWQFAGEYRDWGELYKIGIRHYQPRHARRTQQDPISNYANPPELNRYAYASCDPINLTDPSGAAVSFECAVAVATTLASMVLSFASLASLLAPATTVTGASVAPIAASFAWLGVTYAQVLSICF